MPTTSEPAPLFDLVTGFPPDDALDVTVQMPLSLALYMTMLESTGHASELAVLKRVHLDEARRTAQGIQAGMREVTGPDAHEAARLRITHIVEERVRGINGLRPHVHLFVGTTVRCPENRRTPVDVEALVARVDAEVRPDHRARLVDATTRRCGLTWGPTAWSPAEVLEPAWLAERAEQLREDEPPCAGPWPRRQFGAWGAP